MGQFEFLHEDNNNTNNKKNEYKYSNKYGLTVQIS